MSEREQERSGLARVHHVHHVWLPNTSDMVGEGRTRLKRLCRRHRPPEAATFRADVALGEVLLNVMRHASKTAPGVSMTLAVLPSRIVSVVQYRTVIFLDEPPARARHDLSLSGRGIEIIRGMCEGSGGRSLWRFHPSPLAHLYRCNVILVVRF